MSDLNRDGHLDVAAAKPGALRIFRGDGLGHLISWATGMPYAAEDLGGLLAGVAQIGIVSDDFNDDGASDLLLAGRGQRIQDLPAVFLVSMTAKESTPPYILGSVALDSRHATSWYTEDVSIRWYVGDPESAVRSLVGCGPTTLRTDTGPRGVTFTCKATSAGGTSQRSMTVRRDSSPPIIWGFTSPVQPHGANGWHVMNVTVGFVCWEWDSRGSGLAYCPPDKLLTSSANGQTVTGTTRDVAGNTRSATVGPVKVDTVNPAITCPSPTPVFVRGTSGTVTAKVTDAHSGPRTSTVSRSVSTSTPGTRSTTLTGYDVAGHWTTKACSYRVL
jgi:hypothetical protein